jgi:hypothetical protein
MSTQNAPPYNPEPFNPNIYENLKDENNTDYIDNATLDNCNINNSTLENSTINDCALNDCVINAHSLSIIPLNPSISNPSAGINNVYNTGSVLGFYGEGNGGIYIGAGTISTKIIIDSKYGSVPPGVSSLFHVNFVMYTNTQFWVTKFDIQIYPNKLWNNNLYVNEWSIGNKIDGNSNYNYTNATYAPNGRWYWTYNQQFSNLGSGTAEQGWLVPQADKINILFSLPSSFTPPLRYECHVTCLDATPCTETGTGWIIRKDFAGNW